MRNWMLALALVCMLPGCANGDLEAVRTRWVALHAYRDVAADAPGMHGILAQLDAQAGDLLKRQAENGGWGDVADAHSPLIGLTGDFFSRPQTLARAYATPGSHYYHDPTLPGHIRAALRFVTPLLPTKWDNWWARDVGMPTAVAETFLFLGDQAPDRAAWLFRLHDIATHPQQFGWLHPGTGANALSIARVTLMLAVLEDDPALLTRARNILADAVRVNPGEGEGLMPDGSFHQHGNGLEFSYGASFLQDAAELLWLVRGTAGALPTDARAAVAHAFADYAVWESFRGKLNPFSLGRGGTRPGAFQAQSVTRAALFLLDAGVPEARDAALAHLADYRRAGDPIAALLPLAGAVKDQPTAAPPTGVRAYPHSDYLIARTADFFFGVRLASTHTKGWFTGSGENLLGYGAGEGAYTLLTDGLELNQDTAVNRPWEALPGVTACPDLRRPAETVGQSITAVAALEDMGILAADYRLTDGGRTLTGRKSYIVMGGAVALLGSDIHGDRAATTLLSLPVRADATTFRLAGEHPLDPGTTPLTAPLWYRHVGLQPLGGDPAEVTVAHLTRAFDEVNTLRNLPVTYNTTYLSVRVPNRTGRYAALLRPGVDAATLDAPPPMTIVAQTDTLHAVRRADGSAAALACFTAGHCPVGGLDRPGVLLWTRAGDTLTLAVQSPTPGPIRVTLPFALHLPGAVRSVGGTTITVAIPGVDVVRVTGKIVR